MVFETDDVYVAFTQPTNIDDLVGVYNCHPAFIRQHLNRTAVTRDWMAEEIKATLGPRPLVMQGDRKIDSFRRPLGS